MKNHVNPMVADVMIQLSQRLFNAAQAADPDLCLATMRYCATTLSVYIKEVEKDSGANA